MNFHATRTLAALACVASLAGCATTSGQDANITRSGFDGATVVDMRTHGTVCGSLNSPCLGLGAQWSSAHPNEATLKVSQYLVITAITGAKLSIDGEVIDLGAPSGGMSFSPASDSLRESRRSFTTEMTTVKKLAGAKSVWLRVITPTGYFEDAILDGQRDSHALHAMRRFAAAVEQRRPAP